MAIEITILPGRDKTNLKEDFHPSHLRRGNSFHRWPHRQRKNPFINDIELLAQRDTITGRLVMLEGCRLSDSTGTIPQKSLSL